jgi:hypothetical protein
MRTYEVSSSGSSRAAELVSIAGLASIGAGAIHATAAGMHNDHRQALWMFVALAVFQIGWGALALRRPVRWNGVVGAAGNAAALGGWVLAKTAGIGFIDGLEESEGVQTADAIAAGLATVVILAVTAAAIGRPGFGRRAGPRLLGVAALATAAATLPGMVSAGGHSHDAGGHGLGVGESADGHAHDQDVDPDDHAEGHDPGTVAPRPFDPTLPIDLGGVAGVTPEQQARAENLLAINLLRLPQWADTAVAEAAGYHSIGDAATGDQHYINWSLIDDGRILDPDYPESLVYSVDRGGNRTLEAAMYMLPTGTTLDTVPDIGGKLTQFHIHNNLCFTDDPVAPQLRGVIAANEECRPPLVKLAQVPMIHVWIVPNRCGPFAALEGIGAGQVREGEERLCDAAHGFHGP